MNRRTFTKMTATTVVGLPTVLLVRKSAAATRIVFRDPGGPLQQAFTEAFYKPFNEMMKGKVEVVGVASSHEPVAQIKAMVEARNYAWDAADLSAQAHTTLRGQGGYLEDLEIEDDPHVQEIPKQFRESTILGTLAYATVLTYRTDVYGQNAPTGGWKDLWNVQRFPGRRAIRKHPFETIEAALLADGVAPENLYPCDLDRAFRSLEKLRPYISVWWTGGAQSTQLMTSREVDICVTWNGRASVAIENGAPFVISWNQGLFTYEGWVILKGGPKVEACREFIKFCAHPERQAAVVRYIAGAPANPKAFKWIDEKRAKDLPTWPANLKQMVPIKPDYWAGAGEKTIERFNKWMLA
jgi:putative spermidine/putrescine transport system substrate-binding protein